MSFALQRSNFSIQGKLVLVAEAVYQRKRNTKYVQGGPKKRHTTLTAHIFKIARLICDFGAFQEHCVLNASK